MTHSDYCWVVQKKCISNLHVVGMLDNLNFFSYLAVLPISGLWSPNFQWSPKFSVNSRFWVLSHDWSPPPRPIPHLKSNGRPLITGRKSYDRLILCLRHQSLIVHSRSKVVHVYSLLLRLLRYCNHKASKHYDKKIPIISNAEKEWGSKAWFAS